MDDQQAVYPKLNIGNWWELRKLAQKDPDLVFTPKNISNLLGISIPSVFSSIFPALKELQIINKNGSFTSRGKKWLDDNLFPQVCRIIIDELYPPELTELAKNPATARDEVKNWFAEKTGAKSDAVLQMTATFLMLIKAEIPESQEKKTEKKALADSAGTKAVPVFAAPSAQPVSAVTYGEPMKAAPRLRKRKYERKQLPKPAPVKKVDKPIFEDKPLPEALIIPELIDEAPVININIDLELNDDTSASLVEIVLDSTFKYLCFEQGLNNPDKI